MGGREPYANSSMRVDPATLGRVQSLEWLTDRPSLVGHDERHRRLGPGLVLLMSMIEPCFEFGLDAYEFGGPKRTTNAASRRGRGHTIGFRSTAEIP
jgi:hypothetical protein